MDVANLEIRADSSSVRTATASITGMGAASSGAMSKVKLLSGALVAMGAGRVLSKVISDTNAFTKSISELSAITGATGKDLAFYEEQAALIGKTTTLSASQAATAFKLIASAKPDLLASKEALAAVTKEAVTLAEAAGVGLADAAQTVGVSLNQFGAEADQAARFVNVLAAGAKMGSSSITDTSQAMKNAGVAAKLAGLSFEEANVGVQLLAKGGLFAAEAGTGFRQVLLKLENEAENKFKPSIVGLAGALENLAAEEMTLTELTELFGAEAMKSAAVMIDGAADARTLEAAITGTSIASEMAATNFDNMAGDTASLESANSGLAITLGLKLEPAIRKSIQATTDFSLAVDEFVQSDKFVLLINISTKALMAFSIVIGVKLIAALGASVMAFSSAATAATLFGRAITLMGGPISAGVMALWGFWEILQKIGGFKADGFKKELQMAALGGVEPLKKHIQQLRFEQDRLRRSTEDAFEGTMKYRREFAELQITTEALTKAEAVLTEHMDIAAASIDVSSEATDELTGRLQALTESIQQELSPEMLQHIEIVENQTDKYKDLTLELSQQMTQVTMNAREQFLYNNQLKLGVDATMEERLSVETLSGALFDAEVEQKAFTVAQDEMTKATDKLTNSQEIQKNMIENVQKSFGDLIYKTLDDGKLNFKSFFASVLDGFKRMIAELAAQKIMNAIFGSGGLDGFLSSLNGGFGSIISGITSGLGNLVTSFASSITSLASSAVAAVTGGGGAVAAQSAIAAGTSTMAANAALGASTVAAAGGTAAGVSGITAGMAAAGGTTAAATTLAAGGTAVGSTAAGVAGIEAGMAAANSTAVTSAAAGSSGAGMLATLGPAVIFALFAASILGRKSIFDGMEITEMTPQLAALERLEQARNTLAQGGEGSFAIYDDAIAQAQALGINVDDYLSVSDTHRSTLNAATTTPLTETLSFADYPSLASFGTIAGLKSIEDIAQIAKGIDLGVYKLGDVASQFNLSPADVQAAFDQMKIDGSFASGMNRIPFDGFRAELHEGERVQSVAEVKRADLMASEMNSLRGNLNDLMLVVAKAVSKSARIESRWDINGLPPTRT